MLRYVADPKFSKVPTLPMLSKEQGKARAALINPTKAACTVEPSKFAGLTESTGGDTIYLSVIDKDGNIVSLIQSLYSSFGSGITAPGTATARGSRPTVISPRSTTTSTTTRPTTPRRPTCGPTARPG